MVDGDIQLGLSFYLLGIDIEALVFFLCKSRGLFVFHGRFLLDFNGWFNEKRCIASCTRKTFF